MREISDEQLMQQYADGNTTAFDTLYQRHRGPMYRYLTRQTGDATLANDLYQGVWEKVILARARYRPDAKFTTWLYRIAHNHMIDHWRKQKPMAPAEALDTLESAEPEFGEQMDTRQRQVALLAAIKTLPEDQRDTLVLKLETGMSLEEIGEITGVNRETVKSRLRYASSKLKQLMQS